MIIVSNKLFDVLKWLAILALPAASNFVVAISKIWNFEELGTPIGQTITAVGLLLGALLGISSVQYNKKASDNP